MWCVGTSPPPTPLVSRPGGVSCPGTHTWCPRSEGRAPIHLQGPCSQSSAWGVGALGRRKTAGWAGWARSRGGGARAVPGRGEAVLQACLPLPRRGAGPGEAPGAWHSPQALRLEEESQYQTDARVSLATSGRLPSQPGTRPPEGPEAREPWSLRSTCCPPPGHGRCPVPPQPSSR